MENDKEDNVTVRQESEKKKGVIALGVGKIIKVKKERLVSDG